MTFDNDTDGKEKEIIMAS